MDRRKEGRKKIRKEGRKEGRNTERKEGRKIGTAAFILYEGNEGMNE